MTPPHAPSPGERCARVTIGLAYRPISPAWEGAAALFRCIFAAAHREWLIDRRGVRFCNLAAAAYSVGVLPVRFRSLLQEMRQIAPKTLIIFKAAALLAWTKQTFADRLAGGAREARLLAGALHAAPAGPEE